MVGGHESHQVLTGMLKAGNIRLEMHESVQQVGLRMKRWERTSTARYG